MVRHLLGNPHHRAQDLGAVPELLIAAPALNAAGGCNEESSELLAHGVAPESEAPSQACSSDDDDDDELEYLQLQASEQALANLTAAEAKAAQDAADATVAAAKSVAARQEVMDKRIAAHMKKKSSSKGSVSSSRKKSERHSSGQGRKDVDNAVTSELRVEMPGVSTVLRPIVDGPPTEPPGQG